MSIYTIRDVDEKTREIIQLYARQHELNVAEALRELVFFGLQHVEHTKKEKKHSSIFEVQKKLGFRGGPSLSQKIDEVAYEA